MHAAHMSSDSHHAMVETHGDQAMGFAHDKTTHHFRLLQSGGTIEVKANDDKDSSNIEAIRMHLGHIAKLFSEGDFSTPMFVHDSIPPGVTTMSLLKEKIRFQYQAIDAGGRVDIDSDDPVARAAIHDFLRFQITDHGTGDALDVDAAK
jgi:TusA-related sulfurtransferase